MTVVFDHPVNHRRAEQWERFPLDADRLFAPWRTSPGNLWVCKACRHVSRSWSQADAHTFEACPQPGRRAA